MVLNVQTASQLGSPPPKQHQPHLDAKVDPLPSSPIVSSPLSPSSPGESIERSNQKAKKKKKQNKQGGNQAPLLHMQLMWRNI